MSEVVPVLTSRQQEVMGGRRGWGEGRSCGSGAAVGGAGVISSWLAGGLLPDCIVGLLSGCVPTEAVLS
jgi:hypothetical protein